jgi:NhaP-type Na+/H+ and K+/H+ antiporter
VRLQPFRHCGRLDTILAPDGGGCGVGLEFPRNAVVCAILRRNDVVIPRGDVRFEAGDEVLALVDEASASELAALFGAGGRAGEA